MVRLVDGRSDVESGTLTKSLLPLKNSALLTTRHLRSVGSPGRLRGAARLVKILAEAEGAAAAYGQGSGVGEGIGRTRTTTVLDGETADGGIW